MKRIFLTFTLAAALALPAAAYDNTLTHPTLTIIATQKSAIYRDGDIMRSLGLLPANQQAVIYYGRNGNTRTGLVRYSMAGFIGEGAWEEDRGIAPLNHFFDPVFNRSIAPLAHPSWQWMTEPSDIAFQDYSLKDARDHLTQALTNKDGSPAQSQEFRTIELTTMLRTLGHAMHHMQDMAQPQHVRHDRHFDAAQIPGLYNPSFYEHYTKERNSSIVGYALSADAIYTAGDSPTAFQTPKDFWFNSAGTGIAQTVNRDFVSRGTNFTIDGNVVGSSEYALPKPGTPTDYTPADVWGFSGESVPTAIQNLCTTINCTITMYPTEVSQRASTLSIFDQDLRASGRVATYTAGGVTFTTRRFFDLNRFNYDNAHPVLIKRAVEYSAGLVNYFFRGKLRVNPPSPGPYAVVDHATGEGFRKIRAEIMNDTTNEVLAGGTIRLIAKYHRNGCYKPDLSGEFTLANGQLVDPCPNFRSEEEYISVSLEQEASFGKDEFKQMSFTLVDPIPVDATDLTFTVYYTGQVGLDPDSFAIGSTDVSEPNFVTIWNSTDIFELSGAYYPWQQIIANVTVPPFSAVDFNEDHVYLSPPDLPVQGLAINYGIYVDGDFVATANIPEGRYARIVTLGMPETFQLTLEEFGQFVTYDFPARRLQYYFDGRGLVATPLASVRETKQFSTVATHRFYPVAVLGTDEMPKSAIANVNVLIPVQLDPHVLLGGSAAVASSDWSSTLNLLHTMRERGLVSSMSDSTPTPDAVQLVMPIDAAAKQAATPAQTVADPIQIQP